MFVSRLFVAIALLLHSFLPAVQAQAQAELPDYVIEQYGPVPEFKEGPLSPAIQFASRVAFVDSTYLKTWGKNQALALTAIGESGDARLAWIISDMLRFVAVKQPEDDLLSAASQLLGKKFGADNSWRELTNHLLAWDIPAPPEYLNFKRLIFTSNIPSWENLFVEGDIDWRLVSWGGVLIDGRAYDQTDDGCNCIPAADNPEVSLVEDAAWLKDADVVFGIVINGEARAYPRRIMEVREMVNDTLGGRDLGIPYCSLCGAAQAFYTDELPQGIERPVLRTSGLLSRSNKVMYDLNTSSLFDTFRGKAVTGPLAEKELTLQQVSVITTDWKSWKASYPESTVLLERYALGRNPNFRNTRDADGPIFPIGDVDPRLPEHEDIIGVITASGVPVAFPRSDAFVTLSRGDEIVVENVQLELSAAGIIAVDTRSASEIEETESVASISHQAFWFAWSQFYPTTQLWRP